MPSTLPSKSDRLRELIYANGVSLRDFSRTIGMSEPGFHLALTRNLKNLRRYNLHRIATALNLTMDQLESQLTADSSTDSSFTIHPSSLA